jgi:transposase InsO family protein
VATHQGWLYVAVILDLYARRVVAWEAAEHLRTDLPLGECHLARVNPSR